MFRGSDNNFEQQPLSTGQSAVPSETAAISNLQQLQAVIAMLTKNDQSDSSIDNQFGSPYISNDAQPNSKDCREAQSLTPSEQREYDDITAELNRPGGASPERLRKMLSDFAKRDPEGFKRVMAQLKKDHVAGLEIETDSKGNVKKVRYGSFIGFGGEQVYPEQC